MCAIIKISYAKLKRFWSLSNLKPNRLWAQCFTCRERRK